MTWIDEKLPSQLLAYLMVKDPQRFRIYLHQQVIIGLSVPIGATGDLTHQLVINRALMKSAVMALLFQPHQ